MAVHTMQLQDEYYKEICNGNKRYEARLYDEKRKSLRLLDVIQFTNVDTSETMSANIVELSHFKTFRDGLSAKDFAFVVPGVGTIDDAEQVYKSIYGDKEQENGVIFIKLQLIK